MPLSPARPMVPDSAKISCVKEEIKGVFTLDIDVKGGMQFQPGQFTMLYMFGVGEVPISISGDPNQSDGLVHTIRAVGSVTQSMQRLQKGDVLGVRGPYGQPWPVDLCAGKDVVIIAGGLGLAPLRPVIYQLIARRQKIGRIYLLYGSRSPEDILYHQQLLQWHDKNNIDVMITVDHGNDTWRGQIGVVPKLLSNLGLNTNNTLVFTCGPEIMMRYSMRELNSLGVKDEQIFLSLERNMHCAIGLCGHCQYGPEFICKDGPVFRFDRIRHLFNIREL